MTLSEDKLDLIIEILRQHDKRFEQIDKRFEQIDKRFEQIESRINDLKDEIREVKYDLRSDRNKLQEVYEARERVTVNFTRSWIMASFFVAFLASAVVLVFDKAF